MVPFVSILITLSTTNSVTIISFVPFRFFAPNFWLFFTFNTLTFIYSQLNFFPISNLVLITQKKREQKFYPFSSDNTQTLLTSNHAIIDPIHSILEPNLTSSTGVFDRWIGIPFKNTFSFTYISSPRSSEILILYKLATLIFLYSIIHSSIQIGSLVLHIIFFRVVQHVTQTFISHIASPVILPSNSTRCVGNHFTFKPLSAKGQ